MIRHIARLLTIALFGLGIVACSSDDNPVCAAEAPAVAMGNPRPQPRSNPGKPAGQRTTSKVQDKPRGPSGTTNGSGKKQDKPKAVTSNPAWRSGTKPTTWSGYNPNSRNWSTPYRKGYDAAPQPVIINNYYGHDYRTYPGYIGYYPVGYWPRGYGEHYDATGTKEAEPETTASPSPAPTVTVTVPPSTPPSSTPAPSETPR